MALPTLQTGLQVKRRVSQFSGIDSGVNAVSPEVRYQIRAFFEVMGQLKGNPNLVVVPFDEASDTEIVIGDAAAGTLYAVYLRKDTATASFFKLTDHASASSDADADIVIKSARIGDEFHSWPSGWAFASGLVAQGNTAASTGTGSASNGAKGFAIIGAA